MNAEQTIINCIIKYPNLYKDINFIESKAKVLNHLFFVNGNGFEWYEGELVYLDVNGKVVEEVPLTLTKDYFNTPIMSEEECSIGPYELCSKEAGNLYPICKYAKILNLPDDIKPDWLKAVEEAYMLGEAYYDEPLRYCRQFYVKTWLDDRNYNAAKGFVADQRELLYLAYLKIQKLKSHVI